jgi:hypothetical protein
MLDIAHSASLVALRRAPDMSGRSLSWFAQMVEKGKTEPFALVVAINSDFARFLLGVNEDNRSKSRSYEQKIETDIHESNWELNGETIVIAKCGRLNNGQTRLQAVIDSGKTIQTFMVFGVTRESRMTVDMGRPRSAGNFLQMSGAKNAFDAAAITRLLLLFDKGIYEGVRAGIYSPSKPELRKYFEARRKEIEGAIELIKGEPFAKLVGTTPLCAAHVIIHRLTEEGAAVFFAKMLSGSDGVRSLPKSDPIVFLRNRFMRKTVGLRNYEKLETILRYWNAWRAGQKLGGPIPRKGSYPKVTP